MPGWRWSLPAERVDVLVTPERRTGLDAATAETVARLQGEPDPATTAALAVQLSPAGFDLGRLVAVDGTAAGALAEAVAAIGLPPVTTRLLTGAVAATDLPGAVAGEHRGVWGTVVETLLARPEGTSLLSRMRRWDHDHPARSVAYVVTLASLATVGYALAATDGHALSRGRWRKVVTVAAVSLTVDATANAALLAAVRHRLRRARP